MSPAVSSAFAPTLPSRRRLALLAVAMLALVLLAHPVGVAVRVALLIPNLFPISPVRPLLWLTAQPQREEVAYEGGGIPVETDLYHPDAPGRYGATLFLLGVNPLDRRDPIVVGVAEGLARTDLAVLIHDSPELKAGRVVPQEAEAIVAAFRFVSDRPYVDPGRVGFAGFSVGSSLSLLAAANPAIRDQVAFLNAFGGYADAVDLLKEILARRVPADGPGRPWPVEPQSRFLFARQLVDALPLESDRAILESLDLGESQLAPNGRLASLSPAARQVHALLTNPDPDDAVRAVDALPRPSLERLRSLSPLPLVRELRTRLFLMHDRGDAYIPYEHSRRLAAAAEPARTVHTEFAIFQHVVPTGTADLALFLGDLARLFWHLYRVLLLAL